jgi:hypothetical protein
MNKKHDENHGRKNTGSVQPVSVFGDVLANGDKPLAQS